MTALDIAGQRFGMLTAIRPTEERSKSDKVLWEFRCDCGNTVFLSLNNVKAMVRLGRVPNCGCEARMDITGQRFGMLTAVRPTEERCENGNVLWAFKCDCGNTVLRSARGSIRYGSVPNCGCENKKDFTAQRFGALTVVRPTEERSKSGKVLWEFRCDCGSTVFRTMSSVNVFVKQGGVPSCGCRRE